MLTALLSYPELTTMGLLDGTIYDVIPIIPGAVGNTTVNATTYRADCGIMPGISLDSSDFIDPEASGFIAWNEEVPLSNNESADLQVLAGAF